MTRIKEVTVKNRLNESGQDRRRYNNGERHNRGRFFSVYATFSHLSTGFPDVFNCSVIQTELVNKYSLLFTVKVSQG